MTMPDASGPHAARTDRAMVMDVHDPAARRDAFRCDTEHLEGARILAEAILRGHEGGSLAALVAGAANARPRQAPGAGGASPERRDAR